MLLRRPSASRAFFRAGLLILLLSATCFAQQPFQSQRVKFNFNHGWKAKVGDVVAAVRLTVHLGPKGLLANGSDLALVDVEVVDDKGNRCPTALDMINFSLNGPAEWRGGIAQGTENYILSKNLPVENGVNRVIIRSTTKAGKITLAASGDGLKPASVEIISRPVSVTDGLSLEMPDAGLSSYLERGPTPANPSFKTSRKPVRIASATAGANSDQTTKSFDDDEETAWANDSHVATGWVQYNFAEPIRLSEVRLKLGNWRALSYPIRITVDGREVFEDATPTSLGYVTLPLKPNVGKSLRIELTGKPPDNDTTNISELDPKNNRAPAAGGDKGTLNIVEIEIY